MHLTVVPLASIPYDGGRIPISLALTPEDLAKNGTLKPSRLMDEDAVLAVATQSWLSYLSKWEDRFEYMNNESRALSPVKIVH